MKIYDSDGFVVDAGFGKAMHFYFLESARAFVRDQTCDDERKRRAVLVSRTTRDDDSTRVAIERNRFLTLDRWPKGSE